MGLLEFSLKFTDLPQEGCMLRKIMTELDAICKKMKDSDFSVYGARALVMILSMKRKVCCH